MKSKAILTAAFLSVSANVIAGTINMEDTKKLPFPPQGELGYVRINPFKTSPLSAIIDLHGKRLSDVSVTVKGKGESGVDISYQVDRGKVMTYDGIPVVGLYPDYKNKVEVQYNLNGEKVQETYKIQTAGLPLYPVDGDVYKQPIINPIKVDDEFKDRLYFVSFTINQPKTAGLRWSTPGGVNTLDDNKPYNFITDTNGDIRWMIDPNAQYDELDWKSMGWVGAEQAPDGKFLTAQGQRMFKFDALGRFTMRKDLPHGYIDFSHEITEMDNGNILVRAAKKDYLRKDGKVVNTVRDHVLELNREGDVVEAWDLNLILDPYRDNLLKAIDQGAVCINVDADRKGMTMEELEPDDQYGDITGVAPGRNWAHINSIAYDEKDDSIILSVRHQGIVKIGRDKDVKWILSAPDGWNEKYIDKVLKPVNARGRAIKCSVGKCEGDFDWSWAQHTAFLGKNDDDIIAFDNGDARGFEQPVFSTDKYSRAVQYRVNEKKMTVEQVWEFGRERGYDWYSPVTSSTYYMPDRDTMMIFSASAGLFSGEPVVASLIEMEYEGEDIKVEMDVLAHQKMKVFYRAFPVDLDLMFKD